MEVSASGCSRFCIASLLSLRPPGALLSRAEPPELSPGCSSGSSPPPSPRTEPAARLQPAPLPADLRRLQPRAASFLIRDILADCRHHSDPDQGHSDPGRPGTEAGPEEDYQDYQDKSGSGETASDRLKRPRKARTAFSDLQLTRLESSFRTHKYLNVQDRMELAASLGLSDTQVKTWYQNRRTKWKRQSAVGLELLAEASRMFLPAHFLFPAAPPTADLYLYRGPAPLQPR